jgi:predicted amidohydrolase YtcJ
VFVNSMALKLAGVDEKTPDPPGGRFEHDSSGHLTGHVGDRATAVFEKLIIYEPTRDDYRAAAKLISHMMTSKGVTSACDADATPEYLQGYQDAHDAGELRLRIYSHITVRALDKMLAAGLHPDSATNGSASALSSNTLMAPSLSAPPGSPSLTSAWATTAACR